MRPSQVWGCLLHALSVVVTTSIFTETQRLSCGTLWTTWQARTNCRHVIDHCLGCLAGAHAKRWPIQRCSCSRFGVIPYRPLLGAPSMNHESIIWWKLLPSRQKYERSTSKSSKMSSHINFKWKESVMTKWDASSYAKSATPDSTWLDNYTNYLSWSPMTARS